MEDQMHRLPRVHKRLSKGMRDESVVVALPFRCPRCGESTRFRSLTALRAHLQFSHTFPSPPVHRAPPLSTHPLAEDNNHAPSEPNSTPVSFNAATKVSPPPSSLDHTKVCVSMEEGLQMRLWEALKRAEQQLQSEHAQWERQSVHAQWEKHSLRGQIHNAAMVIASLRQQLAISQHQLEQRESEVLSMQSWLSLATQHELRSKENLRNFIEGLLQRLYLAE